MSISTDIKKLIILLHRLYDTYLADKRILLNNQKILEYLFYKPVIRRNNLVCAVKMLDTDFNPVRLKKIHKTQIESFFLSILDSQEKYQSIYLKYKEITNNYVIKTGSKINFDKQLPIIFNYSPVIEKIADTLDDLGLTFVFDWSFKYQEEYLNAREIKPYNFDTDFKVDFYGCLFRKRHDPDSLTCKMYQYAIIYDSKSKKFTVNDFLIQYYLQQMDIHLLRLNRKSKPKIELQNFFKLIGKTGKYVRMHGLKLKPEWKFNVEAKLNNFYDSYDSNHTLFMKHYDKRKNDDLSISEDIRDPCNYLDYEPCVGSYLINQDLIKSLTENKYFFTKN